MEKVRFMLDTNIVGALFAWNPKAQARFNRHLGATGLSSIVIFELRYGIANSRTAKTNAAALDKFLASGIEIAPLDADDAAEAGALRKRMEAKGKPMGHYDLLIAAHALQLNATLVTSDAAIAGVAGLKVEDWSV